MFHLCLDFFLMIPLRLTTLLAFDSIYCPVDLNFPFSPSPDQSKSPQFPIFSNPPWLRWWKHLVDSPMIDRSPATLAYPYSPYSHLHSACVLSSDTIRTCVDQCGSDPSLYAVSAQFLCVVLSEEAKTRGTSEEKSASLTATLNSESGEKLCELLLEVKLSCMLEEKKKIAQALCICDRCCKELFWFRNR